MAIKHKSGKAAAPAGPGSPTAMRTPRKGRPYHQIRPALPVAPMMQKPGPKGGRPHGGYTWASAMTFTNSSTAMEPWSPSERSRTETVPSSASLSPTTSM